MSEHWKMIVNKFGFGLFGFYWKVEEFTPKATFDMLNIE